ncbi:MAG: hypothetical protein GY801_06130 [bacterium]|nr:hypothetical protein [bacterium]
MVEREQMLRYFRALHDVLQAQDVKGEICLYGGAVMCLVYKARPSTKDVDAVFEPARLIRQASRQVAEQYGLPDDWLNDGVKGFVVEHPREVFVDWPHLTIYVVEPDYLLAMKALASRIDGTDNEDIRFLIRKLSLTSPEEVFAILEHYYPRHRIKPATQFFIEEIFETL